MRCIVARRHTDGELLPRTIHLYGHGNRAVIRTNPIHQLLPRLNRLPVDRKNAVIRHKARLCCRTVREHGTEYRRRVRRLHSRKEENAEEKDNGQDEVHCRASEYHDHARQNRLAAIAALPRIVVVRIHARDIVEAAKGDDADRIYRFAIAKTDKARPKADGELIDAHSRQLRRDEMSELVHKDEETKDKYRRENFF